MSRMGRFCQLLALIVGLLPAARAGAGTEGPEFLSAKGGQVINLNEACPLNEFPPIEILFASPSWNVPGAANSVQCLATAVRDGKVLRQGGPLTLGGEIFDEDGDTLRTLTPRTRNLNPYGRFSWPFTGDPDLDPVGILLTGGSTGARLADWLQVDCRAQARVPCVNDDDTACLFGNGRFKVEVDWRSFSGATGSGRVLGRTNTQADFSFLDPQSFELLVRLINGCTDNNHFWVFASAATNVEYTITVEDTQSGATKSYFNPLGTPAPPIQDTAAFATCP